MNRAWLLVAGVGIAGLTGLAMCGAPRAPRPVDLGGIPSTAGGSSMATAADAEAAPVREGDVETHAATCLGSTGFSANGRIHSHGRPTRFWFEHGPTSAHGARTVARSLPARIGAFYKESFETQAGWLGGAGTGLVHVKTDGAPGGRGGFVRYTAPGDLDVNHEDGIGPNELAAYMYTGREEAPGIVNAALSGGDPDLRGARVGAWIRGSKGFTANNAELVFWLQSTPDPSTAHDPEKGRWSNWALTGTSLLDAVLRGGWQHVEYRLGNDTRAWTYAGRYVASERLTYVYRPLDDALTHVNGDIFHMLVFMDHAPQPRGAIDLDEIEIAYPNRSVLVAANGGRLVSAPEGSTDPAALTDGLRNGEGKTWRSAANPDPKTPLEITWALADPVAIDTVQLHQDPDWPSRDVEVLASTDGAHFERLLAGKIPERSPTGKNFAFLLRAGLAAAPARFVRVRILSGWRRAHWGLGEVEIFGAGARLQTDDAWHEVNADIEGLAPGATHHYRLVSEHDGVIERGADRTFTTPKTSAPIVATLPPLRTATASATLNGRVDALGVSTDAWFEWGETTAYGAATGRKYAGLGATPRHFTDSIDGLSAGKAYHYRIVAANAAGMTAGADATFVAR